ncbi:NYN domain-containing protein [Actomonas aquatica]|uniref:NYN domain-containing protein n=1 Tax=Actomonas aquatica TaxID=2866162 RepID=A0ABZ1C7W3_9BACT|nr:NYN domain-containing protein [Opitutus sp. WL0086]WRQ87793.1 NYN domain-containing protein [Opitutus sp. WL0086]
MSESLQHLLVDGNNVGRAWQDVGKLWRRDANAARQQVVDRVRDWHDVMGWRVTVVFDGRGRELAVEQPTGEATFVVAYSPSGVTADTVIEQWVERSRDPRSCVVATGDAALRSTVTASGAEVINTRDLRAWLERAGETAQRRLLARRREGGGDAS